MRHLVRAILLAGLLCNAGCVSWFIHGGKIVDAGYSPDVLVDYTIEGTVPPGVSYHLVLTAEGDGMFERSADGSGTIITNKWQEGDNDHFFCWVGSSHGFEYIMPIDRTQPGHKKLYPKGFYSVRNEGGIEKPNPVAPVDPVATLTPILRPGQTAAPRDVAPPPEPAPPPAPPPAAEPPPQPRAQPRPQPRPQPPPQPRQPPPPQPRPQPPPQPRPQPPPRPRPVNPPANAFCGQCGTKFRPSSRFCHGCGARR